MGDVASWAEALDSAIAAVADSELERLTGSLSRKETGRKVAGALDSLHGSIGRLETPAYDDELVALFYGAWYQPFQVNAARSLLTGVMANRHGRLAAVPRVDIVDFGSGTLALECALCMAVADAAERGVTTPDVRVWLWEPSDAMTRFGLLVWSRFLSSAGHGAEVDLDSWAAEGSVGPVSISVQQAAAASDIEVARNADRWLVAMHAYYAESRESIKRTLADIDRALNPGFGMMTHHRSSLEGVRYVSPFPGPGEPVPIAPLPISGELPLVNRWRRRLAGYLGRTDDARLTRPVEWDPERGLRDNRAIRFHRE